MCVCVCGGGGGVSWCWEFLVCLFACLARPVDACAYRCLLTPTGITYVQQTAYKGQKSTTSRSFLHPVLNRLNLHVTVNSFVTKVSSVASSFSSPPPPPPPYDFIRRSVSFAYGDHRQLCHIRASTSKFLDLLSVCLLPEKGICTKNRHM